MNNQKNYTHKYRLDSLEKRISALETLIGFTNNQKVNDSDSLDSVKIYLLSALIRYGKIMPKKELSNRTRRLSAAGRDAALLELEKEKKIRIILSQFVSGRPMATIELLS